MLALLRQDVQITESEDFHRDLRWFSTFLVLLNGVTIYDRRPVSDIAYLEASLTGLGGCFNNLVYTLPVPVGLNKYTTVHLERIYVLGVLKL